MNDQLREPLAELARLEKENADLKQRIKDLEAEVATLEYQAVEAERFLPELLRQIEEEAADER